MASNDASINNFSQENRQSDHFLTHWNQFRNWSHDYFGPFPQQVPLSPGTRRRVHSENTESRRTTNIEAVELDTLILKKGLKVSMDYESKRATLRCFVDCKFECSVKLFNTKKKVISSVDAAGVGEKIHVSFEFPYTSGKSKRYILETSTLKDPDAVTHLVVIEICINTSITRVDFIDQFVRSKKQFLRLKEIYDQPGCDDESGAECVICLTEPKCTVLLPCRHMCVCEECSERLLSTMGVRRRGEAATEFCPICRRFYSSVLRIVTKTERSYVEEVEK